MSQYSNNVLETRKKEKQNITRQQPMTMMTWERGSGAREYGYQNNNEMEIKVYIIYLYMSSVMHYGKES